MDPQNAGRDRDPHQLPSTLRGIAEVVCIWEGMEVAVKLYRPLNCEVRENPITGSKRAYIAQQAINESR